jgi:hypothetical protein
LTIFDRIIKFFSSIKLAIFILLSLAVIAAVGTITEAHFNDSEVAKKLVYQSPYMYAVLGLLVITLIAVMIDRWPWKQHHTGFVLAHVGIIVLLFGSWITQRYGIDGTMAFGIGEQRNSVMIKDRVMMVYASLDGNSMRSMYNEPVDFLRHPPTEKNPFVINLGADQLRFTKYYQFAVRDSEIEPSEAQKDSPAVRVQLENRFVNMTQWVRRERGASTQILDLGPAKVILTDSIPAPSGHNEVVLITHPGSETLDYLIYNKDRSVRKRGKVRQADTIETGWMDLKVRLLRYLPHAAEKVTYTKADYGTSVTTSAARFDFRGKTYWLGLDSPLQLYLDDRAYILVFGHKQIDLGFPLRLLNFQMDKYQGTSRASSYQSEVEVPGRGKVLISMNEPLKENGFTFYQSSFEQDPSGKPTASILSVNYDPGRYIKYLGSFLIVAGAIVLFYFKRVKWFKKRSPTT